MYGTGARINGGAGEVGLQRTDVPTSAQAFSFASANEDADSYTGNWSLTSYAVCANPVSGLGFVSRTTNATVSSTSCPPGYLVHAVGGGAPSTAGPIFLNMLYPFNNLQDVQAGVTATPPRGVTAQAVCAP